MTKEQLNVLNRIAIKGSLNNVTTIDFSSKEIKYKLVSVKKAQIAALKRKKINFKII